jgi:hypothetical protein
MATGGNGLIFTTWLDLRAQGTRLYGSTSTDGGATWSPNALVYESPSGSVCECCHPSAAVDVYVAMYVTGLDLSTKPTVTIGSVPIDVMWFRNAPGYAGPRSPLPFRFYLPPR